MPKPKAKKTDLPRWNLNDLYAGPKSAKLKADLAWTEAESKKFRKAYEGRLKGLDGQGLGRAIARYEKIAERIGKIMSYGHLLHATNMSDTAVSVFFQTLQERVTDISTETLFFSLELNRIGDGVLKRQLKHPKSAHYAPWVRDVRVFRDHQLSDEAEKLLHEKSLTSHNAWIRLFGETMADIRFSVEKPGKGKRIKEMTLADTLNMLSDKKPAVRKQAAKALNAGLGKNIRTFTLITNTLAKDKEIEDQWRRYPEPQSYRNLSNQVEDEVVAALVGSVRKNYTNLSHRYYKLKAKWFGVRQLNTWDRNAPLPEDSDRRFSWDEAKSTVLSAYGGFAPEMASIAKQFFDKRWIDAPPEAGKDSGAFSHSTVPSVHPYVMMNFHGKARDVMTLAHELGHGVHQVLAAKQGALMSDTPLTLAETASVFGEMLTFRKMLETEKSAKRRRILLAGKVEDMMNTVIRQIAFHCFEEQVHSERPKGELSADRLGKIWMQVQRESLGPAFKFDDEYRHFWAYIPHFLHAPFYVYAYAFGDCLVNSLYDVFQSGHPGFEKKYFDMLKAGGTLRHKELLAPFGLDASDPAFWNRGLSVISGFIDELEETL
ncbi:MAG: M3 family oligoendopeptidase [Rhodospirillales bacterium]|nr:M3 family oligoendopeptidase [Alphaproteobacteria bacterium]MBL6947954.1 M3 family oligoendopeptidase [Rhodospirillales bacterium]